MTYTLSIEEAKQKLDELIPLLNGDDVILTRNGVPAAKISAVIAPEIVRQAGSARGLIVYMSEDFDAPLDEFKEYGP